jgi:heavy metal sensor kinase
MNIRLRLTLWYTAILFIILLIFSVAVYVGLSRSLFSAIDTHLQREAGQVIGGIKFEFQKTGDDGEDHEQDEEYGEEGAQIHLNGVEIKAEYIPEEGVFWRILDAEARPLIDPGYFDNALFDSTSISTTQAQFDNATLANNIPIRLYSVPFIFEPQGAPHGAGIVQVAETYTHIQEVQQQLIFLLGLGIPFTLLAASAGGWFLATNALSPIDRITRAAQQMSANDLHQRLNLKLPNDEVGRLASTFDKMLARLEDAFERQKRFIADASHEMRTPLTILKGDVEVALNRPRTAESYRHTLEMVNQTTDRLTALVQELFLLARTDNNQYPLTLEDLDLARLLTDEVANLMPHAISKDVALNLDAPDALPLNADSSKLSRVFMNLIDNAIKYSNPGDTVNITANTHNGYACVAIADTGPGISSEHMNHLFDRFYRVDKARSRSTADTSGSGAGLGLSIVQSLVQLHGGRIEVTSQLDQGSTFTVWLPVDPTHVAQPLLLNQSL